MMSKSVALEANEGHESREMSEEKGEGGEEDEDEEGTFKAAAAESLTISTVVSTVLATIDQFMFTDDFKRLFVGLVRWDTLMTLRLATQAWKRVVEAFIYEDVRSGKLIVHDGKDLSGMNWEALDERRKRVTRKIPEGIEIIGIGAFDECRSLSTISFPTTLTSIDWNAFADCFSLENVDLLHTNLQELEEWAFYQFSELKSVTIPDSYLTLGAHVFTGCSKPVPSNIDVDVGYNDETIAYLRL
ncbi:hypothetical protein TL16_g02976 [Triparma laevis f. inornata]|uniref:Uncharacterized protein n=1 Tax=Triparma laevis f. inornata TaxID=1714386 RepID=A0A9W7DZU2_9STRA|nr:hypothetical protein TL16_g02976 [Triparma laevis f. inornata]